MIVAGQWKYVYRPGDIDELYDLTMDPDELRNMAGEPACQVALADLRRRLAAWMRETADPLPPPTATNEEPGTRHEERHGGHD